MPDRFFVNPGACCVSLVLLAGAQGNRRWQNSHMGQQRALVASPHARLLDRAGVEVQRSLASRASRYMVFVTTGTALATMAGVLGGLTPAAVTVLATVLVPPVAFLGRRVQRFVRAGVAASGVYRLAKHPVLPSLAGIAEGQWVRVRGHVLPGPSFISAGGRARVVLACYVGTLDSWRPSLRGGRRWELHGVDFSLATAAGERVLVKVAGARYLDRPALVPIARFERRPLAIRSAEGIEVASVYDEDVVAFGDEVEVLGFLRRDIDPGAESGSRGAPLTAVLDARHPWALLIRRPPTP
jgi:hypothetical protein